jgi:hypothetical protein
LIDTLKALPKLKILNLQGCAIPMSDTQEHHGIWHLISRTKEPQQIIQQLAQALSQTSLTHLNLLGSNVEEFFLENIHHNTTLTHLVLGEGNIGGAGEARLLAAIRTNAVPLEYLQLNHLTTSQVEALRSNTTLKTLVNTPLSFKPS